MHPKRAWINEYAEELLTLDGYDDAILGIIKINGVSVVAYSVSMIIDAIMSYGATVEEAYEHFSHNIECAYLGHNTPVYVEDEGVRIS